MTGETPKLTVRIEQTSEVRSLLLLVFSALAGSYFQCRHSCRRPALSFSFLYPSSIIQSSIFIRGLPCVFFPSILPSNTSLRSDSPLIMCPQKLFCSLLIVSIRDLFSSAICNTSSFVLCSVQLTFSIFLHTHISNASSLLISSFLIVQVSAPYVTTLHTMTLMILFFKFLFSFPLKSSFLLGVIVKRKLKYFGHIMWKT